MRHGWWVGVCALALIPRFGDAQPLPPGRTASVGMPEREFAPGVLFFWAQPNSTPQYQDVYSKDGPVSFNPDASCRPWLVVPAGPSSSARVGVRPGAVGAYSCSVQVARSGRPVGTLRVFFDVGPNLRSGTTLGLAAPNLLVFTQPAGGQALPQSVTVNVTGYHATLTRITSDGIPTSNGATMSAAAGRVTITSPVDLFAQRFPQHLYIETASGVEVVQMYFDSVIGSVAVMNPATINLSYRGGDRSPSASFTVSTSAGAASAVAVESVTNWIAVIPPERQVTPATYRLSFNTSILPDGLHGGTVIVRVAGVVNGSDAVPVVIQVSGSALVPGALAIAPASLAFNAVVGTASRLIQTVGVSAVLETRYSATATTHSGGANWLQASPPTGMTTRYNPEFAVVVSPAGLPVGSYSGTVTVSSDGTSFSRAIPISLTVSPPSFTATPSELQFAYRQGAAPPAAASVQLAGTSSLAFTATASSDGAWLAAAPAAGRVGATLSVSVAPTALAAGSHSGAVRIEDPSGAAAPLTIPVVLTVMPPTPIIAAIANAASYLPGPLAAGEIITIFGANLGPADGATFTLSDDGRTVAANTGGVELTVGGYSAPILYAGARQISAIVPYEIAGPFLVSLPVIVKRLGESSAGFAAVQASSAPAVFTADASGTGHAAALNADSRPNTPDRPAAPGEIVQLFVTGEGQTSPPGVTGKITAVSASGPLTPQPLQAVSVTIDGQPATIHFDGEAPGIVAGLMQVNVEVPAGARAGEVPVVVTIGSGPVERSTQAGVTVSVR